MFSNSVKIFNVRYFFLQNILLVFLLLTTVLTYFLAWQNSVIAVERTVNTSDVMAYKNAGIFALGGKFLYDDDYTFIEDIYMAWMMPPFSALILTPLAFVSDNLLYVVWSLIQIVALVVVVKLSFEKFLHKFSKHKQWGLISLMVFVFTAFGPNWDNFVTGQINIILASLILIDIIHVSRKNKKWEGFLIGVAAGIKILPGIFVLYYILTKQWRQALNGFAGFLTTIGISALLLWENTKYYWGELAFLKADSRNEGFAITYFNQSLRGFVDRTLGHETPQISILWVVLALAVLTFTLTAAVKMHNTNNEIAAISMVGLGLVLAAPTSWVHYGVWIVPAVAAILGGGLNRKRILTSIIVSIPLSQQLMGKPLIYLYPVTQEWWVVSYIVLIAIISFIYRGILFERLSTSFAVRRSVT